MREERVKPGEVLAAVGGLTMFGLMWGVWFEPRLPRNRFPLTE